MRHELHVTPPFHFFFQNKDVTWSTCHTYFIKIQVWHELHVTPDIPWNRVFFESVIMPNEIWISGPCNHDDPYYGSSWLLPCYTKCYFFASCEFHQEKKRNLDFESARRAISGPGGPFKGPEGQHQISFEFVTIADRSYYSKLPTKPQAWFGGFEGLSQSPGSRWKIINIWWSKI